MADYLDSGSDPAESSDLDSAVMRARDAAYAAAFVKVAPYTGHASEFVTINAGATAQTSVTASAARTALGLVIGTNVQAYDATLASISLLGTAADKMMYTTGVDTWAELSLSAAVRTVLDDSSVSAMVNTLGGASATGTGGLVRATSASLVTPALGVATATSINKVAITAPAASATLTISDGKTLAATATLTLSGTDSTVMTFPATSTTVAGLGTVQSFSVAQRGTETALTSSAASIAVNLALANNFTHTMTENTTLAAPSNAVAGQSGVITITQHASSPKTLAYNSFWKFSGGVAPTLTAANGAVDVFTYYVNSASFATCQLITEIA